MTKQLAGKHGKQIFLNASGVWEMNFRWFHSALLDRLDSNRGFPVLVCIARE